VLAAIATIVGEHDISIASVMQKEGSDQGLRPRDIFDAPGHRKNVHEALREIEKWTLSKGLPIESG